ncbi:MAG TPA: hypothetical protein VGK81_12125 [Anaerolineae bacterium]
MRISRLTPIGRMFAFLAFVGVLLFPVSSAFAAGAGAVTMTQTFHNATQSFPGTDLCTSATGTLTLTYNGVAHTTFLTSGVGAGTGWATFTSTGDVVFTPDNPANPTYTGHFTNWDGQSFNLKNFTATSILVVHATGSDGSTLMFHEVAHFSVSASGITLSFDKPTCG